MVLTYIGLDLNLFMAFTNIVHFYGVFARHHHQGLPKLFFFTFPILKTKIAENLVVWLRKPLPVPCRRFPDWPDARTSAFTELCTFSSSSDEHTYEDRSPMLSQLKLSVMVKEIWSRASTWLKLNSCFNLKPRNNYKAKFKAQSSELS